MPYGTISSQSVDYAPRSPGSYVKSTNSFGQPDNSFVIRAATPKSDPLRASVSRILQKDVVVGSDTKRKTATVTLSIVVPSADFTATEIDSMALDLSNFISTDTITRLFMGES